MESTTDAAEWKLEVERVLPLLKVHIRTDNKVQFAIDIRILQIWQRVMLKMSALPSFYGSNLTLVTSFDTKFSSRVKEAHCI